MKWTIRAAARGTLTDEAAETIVARQIIAQVDTANQIINLLFTVDADTVGDATVAGNEILAELLRAGAMPPVSLLLIRADEHRGSTVPLISTIKLAQLLGVSAARVRELKKNELEFPTPIKIDGIAGDMYDLDEARAYARNRATHSLGRPRDNDEELLNTALRMLLAESPTPLTAVEIAALERALGTEGGRHVRGKARVLLEVAPRVLRQPSALQRRPEFGEAFARAGEMWSGQVLGD